MRECTAVGPGPALLLLLLLLLGTGCDLWVSAEPVAEGRCPPGTSFVTDAGPQGYRREWCERRGGEDGPVAHGPWLSWHPSGLKAAEGEMRDGRQVGKWTFWDERGDLIETIQYPDPTDVADSG